MKLIDLLFPQCTSRNRSVGISWFTLMVIRTTVIGSLVSESVGSVPTIAVAHSWSSLVARSWNLCRATRTRSASSLTADRCGGPTLNGIYHLMAIKHRTFETQNLLAFNTKLRLIDWILCNKLWLSLFINNQSEILSGIFWISVFIYFKNLR